MATERSKKIYEFQACKQNEREKKNQIQCTVARPKFIKEGYTILLNKSAGSRSGNDCNKLVIRHKRNKTEKAFSFIDCAMKEKSYKMTI